MKQLFNPPLEGEVARGTRDGGVSAVENSLRRGYPSTTLRAVPLPLQGRNALLLAALSLTACAGGGGLGYYSLVEPQPRAVAARTMEVAPSVRWNRVPRGIYDIRREESWTLNGPLLDSLTFIGGLEHDKRIVVQRRKADRKVPNFRADMAPPEIAAMIESFYRIRGGASTFDMDGLAPRRFLGQPGFQFDYRYLGGDEVERRGRAVGTIISGRFYLALFDATRMHYYDAGLPEFERIVESAKLRA